MIPWDTHLQQYLLKIEAGERLLIKDPELALEKLRLAKGQVRKGLNDIRESVKKMIDEIKWTQ